MDKPPRPKRPINPIVFIVLGLAIALYALFITWTVPDTNKDLMYVFAAIGFLFFVVGLIKHLMSKDKPSLKKEEEQVANQFTNISVTNPPVGEKTIILCSKCRSRNYSTSNFCHMCGARLR
ncbi:zinc ribbon domain-containing protein [Candidatus Woesearchaeota archaeon]|nr:zinc ribbon domain-containing protein [Candidatus Woesearchaeota archaeon]